MEKEFVTRDLAVKLKELGFDEDCLGHYEGEKLFIEPCPKLLVKTINNTPIMKLRKNKWVLAPTWQSAIQWFRDKHGLHAEPIWDNNTKVYWFFSITEIGNVDFIKVRHNYESPLKKDQDFTEGYPVVLKWVKSFEKAQSNCLKKLIEIVESK